MGRDDPTRAREAFDRNMRRAAVKVQGARLTTIVQMIKNRATWLSATGLAAVAGLSALLANLDSIRSRTQAYLDERAYLSSLQHPFPALLDTADMAKWPSGKLQLAIFQIDGFRGRLKSAPAWVKLCLTSPYVFPESAKSQFNDRIETADSFIDSQNKFNLQRRLDQIDIQQTEDAETLTINDPFTKLLKRSKLQLLSRYRESEISQLDKAELYLLRNAIYGAHGYPFYTAKLSKYAARKGWSQYTPKFKPELVSPIERCNAFFLQQLHPNQELGALGRGVLLQTSSPEAANFLKPAICACLAQPKLHVECQRESRGSNRVDFRETVDLIVELDQGDRNKVEWTFLEERDVAVANLDTFKEHQEKFYSAALDFNAAIQGALESVKEEFAELTDVKRGPYWGVKLSLSGATLSTLARNPVFSHRLAENVCGTIHRSLESVGPYIPRMVTPVPVRPDPNNPVMEIYDKPITFDDLRIKLTKDYVNRHYGLSILDIELVPSVLVVHNSDTTDLQQYFDRIRRPALPTNNDGSEGKEAELNVSSHYAVDRDGTIYSFMKDFQIARHSIGLDRNAIGITAIGSVEKSLTEQQVVATASLARYLKGKYTSISWIVSDPEVLAFRGTKFWEERLPFKTSERADPGAIFMGNLRRYLSDLQLKPLPEGSPRP